MTQQIVLTTKQLVGLTAVMLMAFAASLGMAFNLDAIAISFATSNTTAGLITSAEMATIALASLTFARLAGRLDQYKVYVTGLAVIVIANIGSILAQDIPMLGVSRLIGGFAVGAVTATVMGTAGRSRDAAMTFGLIIGGVGVMAIVIAFILPRALPLYQVLPGAFAWAQVDGLYIVYVALALAGLFFIRWTPRDFDPDAGSRTRKVAAPRSGWLALLGLGIMFYGHGLLGVFLVKVGRDMGLAPEVMGYVFMGAGVCGIFFPMAAGFIGTHLPSTLPIIALVMAIMATAVVVATTDAHMVFFLIAPVFASLPSAVIPIFLGAMSRVDPSGGLTAAHQAFLLIGVAVAPLVGGVLSDFGGYIVNGFAVGVFVLLGLAVALPGLMNADRLRLAKV